MADALIENPILNSPFLEPWRHFKFTDEGITNEVVDGRRSSSYFIPIARPKKKGKQLAFDTEWTQDRIEGCQTPTVWGCQTPTVWGLPGVARHPPFGEGNSNCRQSLGVWVSGTTRSVGVWNHDWQAAQANWSPLARRQR
jgi:hypothetical protein